MRGNVHRQWRGVTAANGKDTETHPLSVITVGALQNRHKSFNNRTPRPNHSKCIDLFVAGNNIFGVFITGEYGLASPLGMAFVSGFVTRAATLFCKEVNSKEHLDNARGAYGKAKN